MIASAPTIVLALAPMEGVTDAIVRDVVSRMGGVDYCVTEFLRVSSVPLVESVLARSCPELRAGACTSAGVPVHVQLLGGDAERVALSAQTAASLGATVIDLNFGCPAPTVNRHDGGATLLRDPKRVERMVRAVRDALPTRIPVSAKIRLGWSDPDDVVGLARAAEAGGAAWLTIHARTREDGYSAPADWFRLGRARDAVRVPVVANGDLRSREDVMRCAAISGCERFMLGRGAIERPELFRVVRGFDDFWAPWRRVRVVERYIAASRAAGPDRDRVTLCRAKQWLRALANAAPELRAVFDRAKRVDALEAFLDALQRPLGLAHTEVANMH